MAANNTRDILIAEMLGDVGKVDDRIALVSDRVARLIDQVDHLTGELPKILDQMHGSIAAQAGTANAPQEAIQRAIQVFVRQEIKGISVAVKEAKADAVNSLDGDISFAVTKNLEWAQFKCKETFDMAATKFDAAVTESAKVAESRATESLQVLCQALKNRIDEIRAERWKGQYLSMLGACISSGLAVGILAVYILK